MVGGSRCLLGKGLCNHTPPLSYTGFSTMSSQQESLRLWGLPPGVPAQSSVAASMSVWVCVIAPARSWVSLVLFWGLAALQHPLPNSTSASQGHILGQRQPPPHPMGQAERKSFQHYSNFMVGWTLTGTPNSLQALSSAFCGPRVLLNSKLPICTCSIYQPWGSSYSYSSAPREPPSSAWAATPLAWTPALRSVSSLTTSQRALFWLFR